MCFELLTASAKFIIKNLTILVIPNQLLVNVRITLLFLFIVSVGFAQNNYILELEKQLDTVSDYKVEAQIYADIAWEYILEEDDRAVENANKSLAVSEANNYVFGQVIAIETKGLYYEAVTNNHDMAIELYLEAIALCEENDLTYATSIYLALGVLFQTSDNNEKALEYYTIALERGEQEKEPVIIKNSLINIGTIKSNLRQFDEAEALLLKALEIPEMPETNYHIYVNLGNLYVRKKEYERALPFLEKAIEPAEENVDSEINISYYLLAKSRVDDKSGMAPILERAKTSLEDTQSLRNKSFMVEGLANYYKSIGEYETALNYREQYESLLDSLRENQNSQTVLDLEAKYQTEQKDREIERREASQNLLTVAVSGIGLALLLTGFFLYKNRKKNQLLAKQKKLLEATVDEKNVLLKETHHRVKNSFQIVSSLLYLQSESITDKEAQIAMKEAQNRVRSMVLIHQRLYSKDQLVGINAQEYIGDLVKDIIESHQFKALPIQYESDIDNIVLGIETITPIGLIVNELVTNVLKHAFPKVTEYSKVDIILKRSQDRLVLTIKDNGVGFTGDVKDTSFGIKLMKALGKKLKATFDFKGVPDKGTNVTVVINRFEVL